MLSAWPNPPTAGQAVNLTATVTDGGGTPTGSVQFSVGGSAIGSPVPLNSAGVATTTTTFAAAGTESLLAAYSPTGNFPISSGALSLPVTAAPPTSGAIPLAVTAPQNGAFTLTVDTTDTVALLVSGSSATASTTPVQAAGSYTSGLTITAIDTNP